MHLTLSRNPHPHPSLTLFAYMADCIRAALYKLPEPLRMFFHNYLNRAVQRLERLFTLWQSGKLKTRKRPQTERKTPRKPNPDRIRLPRGKMWLLKQAQSASVDQYQIQHLLTDPVFAEFAKAVPAAQRILRPLHTAIGITPPDWLALPPRPRKPRPQKPKRPKPKGAYPRFNIKTYGPGQAFLRDLKKKKSR